MKRLNLCAVLLALAISPVFAADEEKPEPGCRVADESGDTKLVDVVLDHRVGSFVTLLGVISGKEDDCEAGEDDCEELESPNLLSLLPTCGLVQAC